MGAHDELAAVWRWFVETEAMGYSPLYAAIVSAAAADDELLALVMSAPPASHYPLMTLAAVHDLVLAGELSELAAVYRGEGDVDAAPALFRTAVLDHRTDVLRVLHERFVQTNECGRSALIALGLAAVGSPPPVALVDAGASAGLNLLYDRYRLDFGDLGVWGDVDSPVVCPCDVRGRVDASLSLVDVPIRVGLDRAPVDVTDPEAARWLLACTWPDTGRLERTRAAIAIAASSPPDVRRGDLVADIEPLLGAIDGDGPVCVVTSWAFGYLDGGQRKRFLEALGRSSLARPVAWLLLEHAAALRGTDPVPPPRTAFATTPSLMGLTTFADGAVESRRALAHAHPHGGALEWLPSAG